MSSLNPCGKFLWKYMPIRQKIKCLLCLSMHIPNFSLFSMCDLISKETQLLREDVEDQNRVFQPRMNVHTQFLQGSECKNFVLNNCVNSILWFNICSSFLERKLLIHVEMVRQNYVFDPEVGLYVHFLKRISKKYYVFICYMSNLFYVDGGHNVEEYPFEEGVNKRAFNFSIFKALFDFQGFERNYFQLTHKEYPFKDRDL